MTQYLGTDLNVVCIIKPSTMEKYPIIIRLASLFMPVSTVLGLHSMNLALQMVAMVFIIMHVALL